MSCRESYEDMIDHRSYTHNLRLPHSSRLFCRRTADQFFVRVKRVKICRAISLPHTSRFSVVTNCVEAWGRVIQYQDDAYSTDVTLVTFHNRPFQYFPIWRTKQCFFSPLKEENLSISKPSYCFLFQIGQN